MRKRRVRLQVDGALTFPTGMFVSPRRQIDVGKIAVDRRRHRVGTAGLLDVRYRFIVASEAHQQLGVAVMGRCVVRVEGQGVKVALLRLWPVRLVPFQDLTERRMALRQLWRQGDRLGSRIVGEVQGRGDEEAVLERVRSAHGSWDADGRGRLCFVDQEPSCPDRRAGSSGV